MDENLSKQVLAMGFPSVRILLHALANHYNKPNLIPRIEEICHIQEVGCLNIDYFNKNDNKRDTMIILLKECKSDHDLSFQLDKLKPHLDTDKWNSVLRALSTLILLARNIYSSVYESNISLIEEIVGRSKVETYRKLYVDILNTTLYLPGIDDRVGIYLDNS